MKNIHEDVEWSLVNAVPANCEAYLGHGSPESLLGDVLLCHCHLGDYKDFMISQTEKYVNSKNKEQSHKLLNITTE